MKILVDTNVILDALTSREPWNKAAEQIFMMAAYNQVEMCVSASAVTDIYYIVRKHLHDTENAKQVINKLLVLANVLDVGASDCVEALESLISDYEDAVVEAVAKRHKLDYIITRNEKDYVNSRVKVLTPNEFVSMYHKD